MQLGVKVLGEPKLSSWINPPSPAEEVVVSFPQPDPVLKSKIFGSVPLRGMFSVYFVSGGDGGNDDKS